MKLIESGWDYGLKTRRIKSNVGHTKPNCDDYYEDFTDPGEYHWTIGIQHETGYREGYPGCNGLSFMPNSSGPNELRWYKKINGYMVEMKVNMNSYIDPLFNNPTWCWQSFMDKNDRFLPSPVSTLVIADLWWNDWCPNDSQARQIFAIDFVTENGTWYTIEVCGVLTNWPNQDKPIIATANLRGNKYISLNGKFFGLTVVKGQAQQFFNYSIHWGLILDWIKTGDINGFEELGSINWKNVKDKTVSIGMEVYSPSANPDRRGVAHMMIENLGIHERV